MFTNTTQKNAMAPISTVSDDKIVNIIKFCVKAEKSW